MHQGEKEAVFAFNSRNNRCEGNLWGAEGGNDNRWLSMRMIMILMVMVRMMIMKMIMMMKVFFRFSTVEDCVAACGGGQPQERAECHQVII